MLVGCFRGQRHDPTARDKVSLDIFWVKDEALEESANLPDPDVIAAEIVAGLEAALEQFAAIAEDLRESRFYACDSTWSWLS